MAFVEIETWDASPSAAPGPARGGSGSAPLFQLPDRADRLARKAAGTILTALVHLLLLWFLITKLSGETQVLPPAATGSLKLFDFSQHQAAAEPAAAAQPPQVAEPVADPSMIEATAETPLPPPEWTISVIRVANAPAEPGAARINQAGAGSGAGSPGIFDPFAGAAPLRSDEAPAGSTAGARHTLDRAALRAFVREMRNSHRALAGQAQFLLLVSGSGVILQATARGGSAPAETRAVLGRALVGKQLYRAAGPAAGTQSLSLLIDLAEA